MEAQVNGQTLYLSGVVSMQTVTAERYADLFKLLTPAIDTVDLAEVDEGDSACLALLVDVMRVQEQYGRKTVFRHLPEGAALLAQLYEIDDWITS